MWRPVALSWDYPLRVTLTFKQDVFRSKYWISVTLSLLADVKFMEWSDELLGWWWKLELIVQLIMSIMHTRAHFAKLHVGYRDTCNFVKCTYPITVREKTQPHNRCSTAGLAHIQWRRMGLWRPGQTIVLPPLLARGFRRLESVGSSPAWVWGGATAEWIWCTLYVTEHLWWTDIESCKVSK